MTIFKQIALNGTLLKEMQFKREFELQGYLIAHKELLSLAENDEQFEVERLIGVERRLGKGRVDLAVEYKSGRFAIVELKRGNVTEKDFNQLNSYLGEVVMLKSLKALKDDSHDYDDIDKRLDKRKILGVLVGRSVDDTALKKLRKSKPTINVLLIRRYRSDNNEYLTTELFAGFKARDYQKYYVEGAGPFGKGRMVLAAIKTYVSKHNELSYQALQAAFPAELRGTKGKWGCVSLFVDAKDLADRTGCKRHFLNAEDVITLNDGIRAAVSSQWGIGNIKEFITRATSLGVKIMPAADMKKNSVQKENGNA